MELLLILLFGVIFGAFSANIAETKGFNQGTWAVAGFLFGPIGFLAAVGLPDLNQRRYMRLLLEHHGVSTDVVRYGEELIDADAQRSRILGGK